MAYGKKAYFEELREVAAGSITANYAVFGSAIDDVSRLVSFYNSGDQDVYISLDGTTNHLRIGARSGQVFDVTTNRVGDEGLFFVKGTTFYIKHTGAALTTGNVWMQVLCGAGGI